MSVLLLDPRHPTLIPLELVIHLRGNVEYTEEVPIKVRWAIADLGAHAVDGADVLVSTDRSAKEVHNRLAAGEELIEVAAQFSFGAESDSDGEIKPAAGMEEAIWVMAEAVRLGKWESEQTHQTLLSYLREETEEFAEAVDLWSAETAGSEEKLKLELSDLLLQVLFHAQLAQRRGAFDIEDVAQAFVAKMRSRKPYLFDGSAEFVSIAEQERLWEAGKEQEKRMSDPAAMYQPQRENAQ